MRAHLEAFADGDIDRMLATLAPDAFFKSGATVIAPSDFADFFGWAIRELSPTMQIDNILVDCDQVACQIVESVNLEGERRHLNRAAFYRVAGQLIISAIVYDERE